MKGFLNNTNGLYKYIEHMEDNENTLEENSTDIDTSIFDANEVVDSPQNEDNSTDIDTSIFDANEVIESSQDEDNSEVEQSTQDEDSTGPHFDSTVIITGETKSDTTFESSASSSSNLESNTESVFEREIKQSEPEPEPESGKKKNKKHKKEKSGSNFFLYLIGFIILGALIFGGITYYNKNMKKSNMTEINTDTSLGFEEGLNNEIIQLKYLN